MEPLEGFATLGARELARLTFTAERTARRWIRERRAPRLCVHFLQLMFRRTLGVLCQQWEGWTIRNGKLHSPIGHDFTPGEVASIPLLHQQIAELKRLAQLPRAPRRCSFEGLLDFEQHGKLARNVVASQAPVVRTALRPSLDRRPAMKKIAVLVGSLRKDSINRALVRAIEKRRPMFEFTQADIGGLPHYNEDLWSDPPAGVTALKALIGASDGVLIVTPEYNRAPPGVLKNAIDWASRPYGKSAGRASRYRSSIGRASAAH